MADPKLTGVFLFQASKGARGTWKAILMAGHSIRYVKIAGTSETTTKAEALKKAKAKQFVW